MLKPNAKAGDRSLQLVAIRMCDVAVALMGGLLSVPMILVTGILIRLETPGPALFRQVRVGQHERQFVCYKLRTMVDGAPNVGTHEAPASTVTRLGRWLRRLKVDELPQLWNVLRGEMSLVGPRPCLPGQTELIQARRALGAYSVRPGITGPGQVKGIDMSTPVKLAAEDAAWAARPNLADYLWLVAMTVVGKGQGDAIRS